MRGIRVGLMRVDWESFCIIEHSGSQEVSEKYLGTESVLPELRQLSLLIQRITGDIQRIPSNRIYDAIVTQLYVYYHGYFLSCLSRIIALLLLLRPHPSKIPLYSDNLRYLQVILIKLITHQESHQSGDS